MTTSGPREPLNSAELRARLEEAGATDEASLQAALARDPDLRATVEATALNGLMNMFNAVEHPDQMPEFWHSVPIEFRDMFTEVVEIGLRNVPPGTHPDDIQIVRDKLTVFKRISAQAQAEREMPLLIKALVDFANAPDEAAARVVFGRLRDLLYPVEAQQILDENAEGHSDIDFRPRLLERAALLRHLRGAGLPRTLPVSRSRRRK